MTEQPEHQAFTPSLSLGCQPDLEASNLSHGPRQTEVWYKNLLLALRNNSHSVFHREDIFNLAEMASYGSGDVFDFHEPSLSSDEIDALFSGLNIARAD